MKRLSALPLALVVALALVAVVGVTPAMADTISAIGPPSTEPGDWSQLWYENGVGNFDAVYEFAINPADGLAAPGLTGAGFTDTDVVPGVFSELTGPSVASLYFDTNFADPNSSDPITIDLFVLNDGVVVQNLRLDNAEIGTPLVGNWFLEGTPDLNSDLQQYDAVPEPTSLSLIGGSLICLVAALWRWHARD